MLDAEQVNVWKSLLARAVNITLGKDGGGPDHDGQAVGRLLKALEELAVEKSSVDCKHHKPSAQSTSHLRR